MNETRRYELFCSAAEIKLQDYIPLSLTDWQTGLWCENNISELGNI